MRSSTSASPSSATWACSRSGTTCTPSTTSTACANAAGTTRSASGPKESSGSKKGHNDGAHVHRGGGDHLEPGGEESAADFRDARPDGHRPVSPGRAARPAQTVVHHHGARGVLRVNVLRFRGTGVLGLVRHPTLDAPPAAAAHARHQLLSKGFQGCLGVLL